MIDPTKLPAPPPSGGIDMSGGGGIGGPSSGISGVPSVPSGPISPVGDLPPAPTFKAPVNENPDQGKVPILGDLWNAGGVAVSDVTGTLANLFGKLPSTTGLTDYNLGTDLTSNVNWKDPKYEASATGAVALMNDLVKENGQDNMARQFFILGQWQQQNDPESFKLWQKSLADAQSTDAGHAAEGISNYLKAMGVMYNDMSPKGVEGLYDVAPEMAYGGSGSFGQGLANDLSYLMLLQRKAERGAAVLAGRGSGLVGDRFGDAASVQKYGDMGSRLNELLYLSDNDPKSLTDVEKIAVDGMKENGWDSQHALNFLLSHGQGYSHDPGTELALGFALDPLFVASLGAAAPEKIAARIGMGVNTAQSGGRIATAFRTVGDAVGTTAMAVRDNQVLGPIAKVARTVIDPLHALPGARGEAKVDVLAGAGVEGFSQGMGHGAVKDALNRARRLGGVEAFNEMTGVSAMNTTRKWGVQGVVDGLVSLDRDAMETRRVIPEDVLQHGLQNAPKDAVSRIADYTYRIRKFFLTGMEEDQLAQRFAKAMNVTLDTARKEVKGMSTEEKALWHMNSYSKAWTDFVSAVQKVPAADWGDMASKLDDMVILNPHEIDAVAANSLLDAMRAAKPAQRAKLWNAAADKYDLIENFGRVASGGEKMVERKMNALAAAIQKGGIHTALDAGEMKNLPKVFTREFLDHWIDAEGKPMWRLGFKPAGEMATGLLRDEAGKLMPRFSPTIDNVTTALRRPQRATPVADVLGRVIPGAVKSSLPGRALGAARDTFEVAMQTARDNISGERVMMSMEQSFVAQARRMGLPADKAKNVFRIAREYSADRGFTIAGLGPDEFWRASEPELRDLIDKSVVKKDLYNALARSAGGDLRTLGLTPALSQRIRSGLSAAGLNPNNYLGKVTVEAYSKFRYALNPTFFIQAVADAPWFNMYRGIGPVIRGGKALASADLKEMRLINDTLGHTGLYRDLAADMTERQWSIGWQQAIRDSLGAMPGVKENFAERAKNWAGQMVLANEMKFMNSRMGDVVYDALEQTQKFVDDKIAKAATEGERTAWQEARADSRLMIDQYGQDLAERLGKPVTREEVGRHYLAEMLGDSLLEERSAQGLLDYSKAMQKGNYIKPTSVGKIEPLHLDYGAASLGWPNVRSLTDLKSTISRGEKTWGDVADTMREHGFHPDAIQRFRNAAEFNWRSYFDGLARETGMSRYEMSTVEDLISREAKNAGMSNVEYLTQVKTMTVGGAKVRGLEAVSDHMKTVLSVMRAVEKSGGATMDEAVKLVTDNLHPSMKARLLDAFETGITGKNGLIEKAQAAGDQVAMRDLNRIVEELRGGWTPAADAKFKDLVLRRIGGEVIENPEVERAVRYFSKYLQELNPKVLGGEELKYIAESIPVAGASEYDMTQAVLMNTLNQNFRLAEKDAIRLAHMPTERSVLDRSLNHPFFGMYPSSYWFGKVLPETFRFIAREPFGIHTGAGVQAYYKVQNTAALQSQYDEGMAGLYDQFGKSAIVSLFSYLSPGMPWEDIKMSLPPYMKVAAKDGLDITKMTQKEFDTMSPERWMSHFLDAGAEVGDVVRGVISPEAPAAPQGSTIAPMTQQELQGAIQQQPTGPAPATGAATVTGPVQGTGLGPVLQGEMADLQAALSGH